MIDDVMREEHERALRIKNAMHAELETLPKGYISRKKIRGKLTCYLQWREGSKVKSRYIPPAQLSAVNKQVERRKQLEQSVRAVDQNIRKIEKMLK